MKKFTDFILESGEMLASDPCHKVEQWTPSILFNNCKKGRWIVECTHINDIIMILKVTHEDARIMKPDAERYDVSCDSNQFGFFDFKYYQDKDIVEDLRKKDLGTNNFYNAMSYITLSNHPPMGSFGYGVVCRAEDSDSGYILTAHRAIDNQYVEFTCYLR
jgi:hypothetical protein